MNSRTLIAVCCCLCCAALVILSPLPSASAATVTWGTPTTIVGDTDVNLSGTFDRAYNFHRTDLGVYTPLISPIVNGVTFTGFAIQATAPFGLNYGTGGPDTSLTYGTTTLSSTIGGTNDELGALKLTDGDNFGAGSGTFAGLTAPYQALLGSAAIEDYSAGSLDAFTLMLSGLAVGDEYLFQVWVNDSRVGDQGNTTVTSGNAVVINHDVGAGVGDVGQWVTSTFIADAVFQSFTIGIEGTEGAFISGFQLRNITAAAAAVPEPTSIAVWSLLGLSAAALGLARRHRQNAHQVAG